MTITSRSIELRLEIEGFPYEAVTSEDMEATTADGRTRAAGLLFDGIVDEESADIARASVEVSSISVSIVDRDSDDIWTTAFATTPSTITWLDTEISGSATTSLTVMSTAGFTSLTVVHVGTEAISVTGVTPTSKINIDSRGVWNSIGQRHFSTDGEKLLKTRVTDYPSAIEGRRVRLYRYVEGDDSLTGNGTQFWLGVVATEPRLGSDGATWQFTIDPVTSLLETEMGGDLEDNMSPRGVYYHRANIMLVSLRQHTGADNTSAVANTGVVTIPGDTSSTSFESNDDLARELTTAIQSATSSWTNIGDISCIPDDSEGFTLRYTTASTARFLEVKITSPVDGTIGSYGGPSQWETTAGTRTVTLGNNTTYNNAIFEDGGIERPRSIPRGVFSFFGGVRNSNLSEADYENNPQDHLFLDGEVDLTDVGFVIVDWKDGGDPAEYALTEETVATREVSLSNLSSSGGISGAPLTKKIWTAANIPEFDTVESYATAGTLVDWRVNIAQNSPDRANRGGMPFLTDSDLSATATWTDAVDAVSGGIRWLESRNYFAKGTFDLSDFLQHECRLYGVYPHRDSSGLITISPATAPTSKLFASTTITESDISREGFPEWERTTYGSLSSIEMKTGYDLVHDEHKGITYHARDQQAHAEHKKSKHLVIEPKSNSSEVVTVEEFAQTRMPIFGIFGRTYATLTMEVGYPQSSVAIGDIVNVTHSKVPDLFTGTRGITGVLGVVVSKRFDYDSARGSLTLLVSGQRAEGYAPSVTVTSQTDLGGNLWNVNCVFTDPGGGASMVDASVTALSQIYAALDEVLVAEWDAISPTEVTGSISAFTGNQTMQVTFDSTWTPGASTWFVRYSTASTATSGQQNYDWIASNAARISFSTEAPAYTYT